MSRPIASLETLKKNGMDLKKFGCCARREKDGKETVILGCEHHRVCHEANVPVPDREIVLDGTTTLIEGGQRPRNWKYLLVKPSAGGKRKVKEGFCACYEFFENFGKLHGKNGVVCKVTGGEGSTYQARGSKKVPATEPGQDPTWEPKFWSGTVPAFKPPEVDDLVSEEYANKIINQLEREEDDEAIQSALSGGNEARDVTLNIDPDEVAKVLGQRTS